MILDPMKTVVQEIWRSDATANSATLTTQKAIERYIYLKYRASFLRW